MRVLLLGSAFLALLLAGCQRPAASDETAATRAIATQPSPVARRPVPSPSPPSVAKAAPIGPTAAGSPVKARPLPPRRVPEPPFVAHEVARLNWPWAMAFLPDGRLLVTEKPGTMRLVNVTTGQVGTIAGVPAVTYGGQGGLGDVILHPLHASNRRIYFSYVESSGSVHGAVVASALLTLDAAGGGSLSDIRRIWEQVPKVDGQGHFSHRLAFDAARKLWITSGDRQKFDPAQDLGVNLGKVVRLNEDGSVPADNPYHAMGGVSAQIWTLGHRNMLGLAFDATGRLWVHEMGPAGGDELNLIVRGANYGWPVVSNGDHYDGTPIPDHDTRPEFEAPKAWWDPVIAPAGFIIYSGALFPWFRGHGFIGGLASQALVEIEFSGTQARELRRYPMGQRIREVEQGPDGAIWLLEDAADARLLKLTPP
ncbi:PQQ-dependent sugar dehydrogenase [Pseudoxanthomonas sangjuensis]